MHVVATAGHVDHGKSTLVRALTGMEPDRWAEEHRRGLTIDLGYAWTTLPSGATVAFVDVPGHQRFIGNMLAGLGPVPAVVFVVAADEGWSRQSEEHLAAIDALQVGHGLLVVTRTDLADPVPTLVDARARLARTSLGDVEAVSVSAVTGAGLHAVRDGLDRLVDSLPAPDLSARVRLWVDRAFTIRGSGTVVTGTLAAGRISAGDRLRLRDREVTVRGVQSLGSVRDSVDAVARVALNLRGVGADEVARGDALLTPGTWHTTSTFDVRVPPDDLPAQLVLHVGTAAHPVRVRPLGGGHARLTVDAGLPLQVGDRAILRDPGRQAVAAGVLVLDPDPPPLRRRGAAAARAAVLAGVDGRPDPAGEVRRRGVVRRDALAAIGVPVRTVPDGTVAVGSWLVAEPVWSDWQRRLPGVVTSWAVAHPLEPGVPLDELARDLQLPDRELLTPLLDAAGVPVTDGRAGTGAPRTSLGPAEAAVAEVEHRLAADPFAAPDRDDLARLRLGHRELAAAEKAGRLLRVAPDVVLLPSAPDAAAARLATLPQPFTLSDARRALATTRRVAVPLMEHLDAHGLTVRETDTLRRVADH